MGQRKSGEIISAINPKVDRNIKESQSRLMLNFIFDEGSYGKRNKI